MLCDMGTSIGTCSVSKTLWSSNGVHLRSEMSMCSFAHTQAEMPLAYMAMVMMHV